MTSFHGPSRSEKCRDEARTHACAGSPHTRSVHEVQRGDHSQRWKIGESGERQAIPRSDRQVRGDCCHFSSTWRQHPSLGQADHEAACIDIEARMSGSVGAIIPSVREQLVVDEHDGHIT